MLTPHKHPVRDEWIDLKSENVHPFPSERIEESMLYTNIKRRKMQEPLIVRNNGWFTVCARTVVSDNIKCLIKVFINVSDDNKRMRSYLLLIEAMMNDCSIYLSSIETIFNSWNRYLLLSETIRNLMHRCAPFSGTMGDWAYMCARVGAYCIRPSIVPNENGQSFGDSLFIHSSLAGCL